MQEKKEPVFVVATANDISSLPPELLRKGRFDEIFFVDLPSANERENIFNIHLKNKGRDAKILGLDMQKLVRASEGFSGAEIEEVVNEALFNAYANGQKDLEMKNLLDGIKSEIEKEREKVVQQRLAFEAGVETRTDSDSVEGKIQNFLLQKMDFTEHYVDRDIISQFVDTVIPRSETCYEWYMDFDLIEKPNEKKKMVWSFKIDYNEAKTYRKEREGMLRPNQWEDLIVRVYI
ncbi:MAG: hypothetical protein SOZ62_07140 [Eubacteriales bacterium]|nr:hypothetical protein [Eubacteriales bacterium]